MDKALETNNSKKLSSDSNESTEQSYPLNVSSLALSAKFTPLNYSAGKPVSAKKHSVNFQSSSQSLLPLNIKSSQSQQIFAT